jgi:N-acetylmuramic acid 6-phosphate etherase
VSEWLAVDAGGSGARARLGERLWTRTGPASAGTPVGASALWPLLEEVLSEVSPETGLVLGAAGAGSERARRELERELRAQGWRGPLAIGPDYLGALWCLEDVEEVVAILAGTGSVLARRRGELVRRAGGWGPQVGDPASGTELGGRVAAGLARAFDAGEEPPGMLAEGLLRAEGRVDAGSLRSLAARPGGVAALAPSYLAWAMLEPEPRDEFFASIDRLADAARGLMREVPKGLVVLLGGGLSGSSFYRETLDHALRARRMPKSRLIDRDDKLAGLARLAASGMELGELRRVAAVEALSPTELGNPFSEELDALSPSELVRLMLAEKARVVAVCAAVQEPLAGAVARAATVLGRGGRLFYVGAGTSGRLGVLDASESPPTFHVEADRIQGVIAGGERAAFESVEGAEDSREDGAEALRERGLSAGDMVVGVAASGGTPFVHGALGLAREVGASTALVTSNPRVAAEVDFFMGVPTGPEVLRGSTRLGAGTAAKVVLNVLSTGAWVACGKAYGNYMVDLRQANEKLERRARRIVQELRGVSEEEAGALLVAAGGRVKTAVLMHARGLDRAAAEAALTEAGGKLRSLIGDPREDE